MEKIKGWIAAAKENKKALAVGIVLGLILSTAATW
tara:strand:+ start:451 stop:555 length:105 start_codon:yes stop_codon:yes gene_type:complete